MLVFPGLIENAAREAGIAVPPDVDDFDPDEFPHFHFFCVVQLGRSMNSHNEHWENAKVVAKIPEEKIRTINLFQLQEMGFQGL